MSGEKYPNQGKRWTAEETDYLCEHWGTTPMNALCRNLGRSRSAIENKVTQMGLGRWVNNSSLLSFREIANGMGYSCGWVDYQEEKGLKVIRKRGTGGIAYRMVRLEDFWEHLKKHQDEIDLSRMEPLAFGEEPEWVADARRRSAKRKLKRNEWTTEMENKVLTDAEEMTLDEIAKKYGMSASAIDNRIQKLGKLRAKRYDAKYWTDEERAKLSRLVDTEMDMDGISEAMGRSFHSVRAELARQNGGVVSLKKIRKAKKESGDADGRSMS